MKIDKSQHRLITMLCFFIITVSVLVGLVYFMDNGIEQMSALSFAEPEITNAAGVSQPTNQPQTFDFNNQAEMNQWQYGVRNDLYNRMGLDTRTGHPTSPSVILSACSYNQYLQKNVYVPANANYLRFKTRERTDAAAIRNGDKTNIAVSMGGESIGTECNIGKDWYAVSFLVPEKFRNTNTLLKFVPGICTETGKKCNSQERWLDNICFTESKNGECITESRNLTDAARVINTPDTQINAGDVFSHTISIKNEGSTVWGKDSYVLQAANNDTNALAVASDMPWKFINPDYVEPGDKAIFYVKLPNTGSPKTYSLQWNLAKKVCASSCGFFTVGAATNPINLNIVPPAPVDNAQLVNLDIPTKTTFSPREFFPMNVTVKNTGTSTWKVSTDTFVGHIGFQVYPANSSDGIAWSLGNSSSTYMIPNETKSGETATFNFDGSHISQPFWAPNAPGTYHIQFRMVHLRDPLNGVNSDTPFGDLIPAQPLTLVVAQ